jgi:ComF family protein
LLLFFKKVALAFLRTDQGSKRFFFEKKNQKTFVRLVLDLLLPPTCPACDTPVSAAGQVCAGCFSSLAFVTAPFCARCGVPFAYAGQVCPGCAARPPGFDRARAALRYDAQSRRLLLPLKYADRVELAGMLAAHMARAGATLLSQADLLVPVPLHRARLFARRYNQAGLLARALSRGSRVPVAVDALRRLRRTASLGTGTARQRAAELEGAFAVRPSRIDQVAGRRVLLVDDVMTSGATATECAVALRAAGAVTVDVLVAARVPDPRLEGNLTG